MIITGLSRVDLLSVLPKGGTVAEVGVQKGFFAEKIRQLSEPEHLHLIDPWARDEDDAYLTTYHADRDGMVEAMRRVSRVFADDIAAGRVILHRDYSTEVAGRLPDHQFDWVYIDAMHDYDNVRADLLAFRDKVKPEGFILGHDFSNYFSPKRFGVIPAVLEFVQTENFSLVLLTNESNPTYLLASNDNVTTLPTLLGELLSRGNSAPIDVDESLLPFFKLIDATDRQGRKRRIIRFG